MDFFDRFLAYPLEQLPFLIIVLAIAFTFHEFAHAYSAYKFGDLTAYKMGRVTLNPRAHLDVFGTLLILIAGFGWAKPVLVNRSRFRYPRLMGIVVSFVGPLSNLIIAFLGMLIVYTLFYFGWMQQASPGVYEALRVFFTILIKLNIVLFIFNLLPIPPLDGYRIVEDLAPNGIRAKMSQYEQWGIFIMLLMVFIPPVSAMTIQPLFALWDDIRLAMDSIIQPIFGKALNWDAFMHTK